MKFFRSLSLIAVALVASVVASAQVSLNTTTLSTAVTTTSGRTVIVASATGIVANTTSIYVDKELMAVEAINGTTLTVQRGAFGTIATKHVSGASVYAGLSNYFSSYDRNGACTATNEVVLPVINTNDGLIFNCLSSGQWITVQNGTQNTAAAGSARSFCTGTVGTAETEFLNGAACAAATTATARQVISTAGTIANLRVFSSANVVGGANKDVLTVFKNGSSTALTCTIAAAAATCSDLTHSVSVAAGDVLTFQFVTATADTAANVSAAVEQF